MALKKIFANSNYLLGPNQSFGFGNHLSHLLFCYNFSKKRKFDLKICTSSNLDDVFDLNKFKSETPYNLINYFSEYYNNEFDQLRSLDQINLEKSLEILNDNNLDIPNNICFSGWFYNVPLYPDASVFDEIKIKDSIINYIQLNLSKILLDDAICVHYRGTDFNGHLGYDLRLPFDYYERCINHMREHHKHIKNIFIFSEDRDQSSKLLSFIRQIDNSLNVELIQNPYYIDWACLHLTKNIISSNSSFCLTACLNKSIIYQPKKYQLRNTPLEGTYPHQPFFKNSYIL